MVIASNILIAATALAVPNSALSERATVMQLSLGIPKTGAAAHQKAIEEETTKIT